MPEDFETEEEFEIQEEARDETPLDAPIDSDGISAPAEPQDAEPDTALEETETPVIETSFGTVTGRLSEIADVVEDTTLPIDEALDLLEEAVALGMQASNLLESDMNEHDANEEDEPEDEFSQLGEAAAEYESEGIAAEAGNLKANRRSLGTTF